MDSIVGGYVWTKETPLIPGWYWWKCSSVANAKCVEVVVATIDVRGIPHGLVDIKTFEWAGPIPLPANTPGLRSADRPRADDKQQPIVGGHGS